MCFSRSFCFLRCHSVMKISFCTFSSTHVRKSSRTTPIQAVTLSQRFLNTFWSVCVSSVLTDLFEKENFLRCLWSASVSVFCMSMEAYKNSRSCFEKYILSDGGLDVQRSSALIFTSRPDGFRSFPVFLINYHCAFCKIISYLTKNQRLLSAHA